MRHKHTALILGTVFTFILTGTQVVAAQDSLDPLTIAFMSSSPQTAEDRARYQAAMLAVEHINAGDDDDEPGVQAGDGTSYRLVLTKHEAETAQDTAALVEDWQADDTLAVIATHDTSLIEELTDSDTGDLPILLGATDAPTGDTFHALTATTAARVQTAADFLVNEHHMTRIGLIGIDTTEAQTALETFAAASSTDVIALTLTHTLDAADFSADAEQVREAHLDAIFLWTQDAQALSLLRDLQAAGWQGTLVYAGLDEAFIEEAGDLATGLIGVDAWTPAAVDETSRDFVRAYIERWDTSPMAEAADAYDAVFLVADALTTTDPTPAALNTALRQTDSAGVVGIYEQGRTSTLRIVIAEPSLHELVRYEAGACVTCPDTWWADESQETADNQAVFRIGLIAALDGSGQARAEQMEQAAQMAVREINAAGGVTGADGVRYHLALTVYTATNAAEAQAAHEQALRDNIQIVIGPDENALVLPQAGDTAVVQLVSATGDQYRLSDTTGTMFHLRSTDTMLAQAAARSVLAQDVARVATVALRSDYGLDAVDAFTDIIAADDVARVTLALEHDVTDTDFAALADSIARADVQAVAVWTSQPAALMLMEALAARDWTGIFIYGYITPELQAALPEALPFTVIGPVGWAADAPEWVSRDFVARYTARTGETPIAQAAAYYDAVHLIGRTLEVAGAADMRATLTEMTFHGVQGVYTPTDGAALTQMSRIVHITPDAVETRSVYAGAACVWGCD